MKVYDAEGALKVTAKATFADSTNLDAFGRLRTSNPVGLFDAQFQYDLNPLLWESSGATHDANGWVVLTSPGEGGPAWNQSRQYIRYQPGRSQLVLCTFQMVASGAAADTAVRLGYWESAAPTLGGAGKNGVYLKYSGIPGSGVASVVLADGGTETIVAQTAWNVDRMDGTGPSGVTLNWTKSQIFWIDLEWLGVGRVRCGFNVDGVNYPVHEFLNANSITNTYMQTANLPIRYEVLDTGGTSTLIQICSAVFSEGGFELDRGYPFTAFNDTTGVITTGTTRRAILSIRPKATFNSIVNRGTILVEGVDVFISSNHTVLWELVYGGALTGASFASLSASSISEFDVAATTVTGGITIAAGYASSTALSKSIDPVYLLQRLPLTLDATGAVPLNMSIVVTSFTGNATCHGTIRLRELR